MDGKTNKELLQLVLEQTKKNAESQLSFACEVSNFINEQKNVNSQQMLFNSKIETLLESNEKTKQKGIIEQVSINTKDINDIKTNNNIEKKVWGITGAILGTVGGWLAKLFPFG